MLKYILVALIDLVAFDNKKENRNINPVEVPKIDFEKRVSKTEIQ